MAGGWEVAGEASTLAVEDAEVELGAGVALDGGAGVVAGGEGGFLRVPMPWS